MVRKVAPVFVCVLLWLIVAVASAAEEPTVQKLTFGSGGVNRSYYLFVPEKAAAGNAPLLLLLHGSGRNGKTLVEPWLPLAKSEGIVLVALVRLTHSVVDERRMYVCGHSAGAIHGLGLGLLESEYFAGIAAHAAR